MCYKTVRTRGILITAITAASAGIDGRDTGTPVRRRFLRALEVHQSAAIVEQRAQLRALGRYQVTLCLDHEEVGGKANVETALLGLEPGLRQFPGGQRRLISRESAFNMQ